MRDFHHFAVVDWSGQAVARPKGLAVAHARQGDAAPALLRPAGGWSRGAILEWLLDHARAGTDLLVGLDLSPGLPFVDQGAYFPGWPDSPADAKALWRFVDETSAGSPHLSASGFLAGMEASRHFRHQHGPGDLFPGGRGRLRACETAQAAMGLAPSSCFNLIGAAQVGKSSLTGMRVLHRLQGRLPVWPFDSVPKSGPVLVEIYTAVAARAAGLPAGRSKLRDPASLDRALQGLGSQAAGLDRHDEHSSDAVLTAAWLRGAAARPELWSPPGLTPEIAATEGWTYGVP